MDTPLPNLENILDNINVGIIIFDDKGTYLFVNRALLEYTGRSRSDYLHHTVYDFIENGIYESSVVERVYETKKPITQIHTTVSARGEKVGRLVTVSPIFDAWGNIAYAVSVQIEVQRTNEEYTKASLQNQISQSKGGSDWFGDTIIAESPAMKATLLDAARAAVVSASVLLMGESGTGKEVIARYIHQQSARQGVKLVAINCSSLPESLLEAELFGYEKGAFTGALQTGKMGLIESADGSTLLLDEINSIPLSLQAKLLRVLETKTITRIGSVKETPVDFRLVAATNSNLLQNVREGTFRADLYYRLNVIPITIPPLRDRREDIIPLAKYFLLYFCQRYGLTKEFSPKVYQTLRKYDWHGNVRELRNFVERMVVMSVSSVVRIDRVPSEILYMGNGDAVDQVVLAEREEQKKIRAALALNAGHRENTANYLGISRRTLQYKLKKYGIQ